MPANLNHLTDECKLRLRTHGAAGDRNDVIQKLFRVGVHSLQHAPRRLLAVKHAARGDLRTLPSASSPRLAGVRTEPQPDAMARQDQTRPTPLAAAR